MPVGDALHGSHLVTSVRHLTIVSVAPGAYKTFAVHASGRTSHLSSGIDLLISLLFMTDLNALSLTACADTPST